MFRNLPGTILAVLMLHSLVFAQRLRDDEGFDLGSFRFRPVAEVLGAYDNRVLIDGVTEETEGDFYSELYAALYINNHPARYDLSADAGYGYRFYGEYSELNSDFYNAEIAAASTESPLKLGLSSYIRKTLDYDTSIDSSFGEGSTAILSGGPSTRFTAMANIAYDRNLTDKTSVKPGYDVWHYYQDFEERGDAEWQVHRAGLQLGYGYTEKTMLFLAGYYSLQVNNDEDGKIGSVTIGAEGSMTEKSSWMAHVGFAAADYEISGTAQGVVGHLEADWLFTEKISAYLFGSSSFEPGYNGGSARRVYRLGYGATWRVISHWAFIFRILHDYDEELGDTAASEEELRNFVSFETEYDLVRRISLNAGIEYIMDEEKYDQTVVSLRAIYRY